MKTILSITLLFVFSLVLMATPPTTDVLTPRVMTQPTTQTLSMIPPPNPWDHPWQPCCCDPACMWKTYGCCSAPPVAPKMPSAGTNFMKQFSTCGRTQPYGLKLNP